MKRRRKKNNTEKKEKKLFVKRLATTETKTCKVE